VGGFAIAAPNQNDIAKGFTGFIKQLCCDPYGRIYCEH
jgi:hypothetical protein